MQFSNSKKYVIITGLILSLSEVTGTVHLNEKFHVITYWGYLGGINVNVETNNKEIDKKPEDYRGKKGYMDQPFGHTELKKEKPIEIKVTMDCKDSAVQHQNDYKPVLRPKTRDNPIDRPKTDDKHENCNAECTITGVELTVSLIITYNIKKIEEGWFDLKSKDAYTGQQKRKEDVSLDKESVKIHEMSHCEDIKEQIKAEVENQFSKQPPFQVTCKCSDLEKCNDLLKRQVEDRIIANAMKGVNKLLDDVARDYRESDTEIQARKKQAEYLKNRKK